MAPPSHESVADQLRELIDLWENPTQEEVAKRLGVRREYISRILNGLDPSAQMKKAIESNLTNARLAGSGLTGWPAPGEKNYPVKGRDFPDGLSASIVNEGEMMIDPRHAAPPSTPTAEQCRAYFEQFLKLAAREEGGLGWTWRQLQKEFPMDEFDQEKKGP